MVKFFRQLKSCRTPNLKKRNKNHEVMLTFLKQTFVMKAKSAIIANWNLNICIFKNTPKTLWSSKTLVHRQNV